MRGRRGWRILKISERWYVAGGQSSALENLMYTEPAARVTSGRVKKNGGKWRGQNLGTSALWEPSEE